MTTTLCGECGGRLDNHRCVDCGTNHESLQQWASRQIVEYRLEHPGCRADRACVARLHERNCPIAIAEELAKLRRTSAGGWCDTCGKQTIVTDVWIGRTPMTLCQPCTLNALTAEGERLGNYFGWEIE